MLLLQQFPTPSCHRSIHSCSCSCGKVVDDCDVSMSTVYSRVASVKGWPVCVCVDAATSEATKEEKTNVKAGKWDMGGKQKRSGR